MAKRPIPWDILKPFLMLREKKVLRVYDDKHPKRVLKTGDYVEGVLTAGIGHTGLDVKIGMPVTDAIADAWLELDVEEKAAKPLEAKLSDEVLAELTEHQYAALLSFVFNVGTATPGQPEWTIWKRLRDKQFDQVPLELMKFVNWDGQKSEGLVARRAAEVQLWSTAEPGSTPETPSSAVTRQSPTPPTPADPKKFGTPVILACGTAVAATTQGAKEVYGAIQPYVTLNPWVGKAAQILTVVLAILAVANLVVTWSKHRANRN